MVSPLEKASMLAMEDVNNSLLSLLILDTGVFFLLELISSVDYALS